MSERRNLLGFDSRTRSFDPMCWCIKTPHGRDKHPQCPKHKGK